MPPMYTETELSRSFKQLPFSSETDAAVLPSLAAGSLPRRRRAVTPGCVWPCTCLVILKTGDASRPHSQIVLEALPR